MFKLLLVLFPTGIGHIAQYLGFNLCVLTFFYTKNKPFFILRIVFSNNLNLCKMIVGSVGVTKYIKKGYAQKTFGFGTGKIQIRFRFKIIFYRILEILVGIGKNIHLLRGLKFKHRDMIFLLKLCENNFVNSNIFPSVL